MSARSIGGFAAAMVLFALSATAARGEDACWQLLYRAVEHNAAVAHPPYVSYNEKLALDEDGRSLEFAHINVTYRDDGIASVDDDRFAHPFLSAILDPGPPVLGPYGERRAQWLSLGDGDPSLKVIAETETPHRLPCVDVGDETIDGTPYAHLTFPEAATDRPALKAVWIDRTSLRIRRAVVSEWLAFYVDERLAQRRLTDYTLEIAQVGPYDVLTQVNWSYVFKSYGQRTVLSEEYTFAGYRFETRAPAGTLFADASP
jgi:hypothetical protein